MPIRNHKHEHVSGSHEASALGPQAECSHCSNDHAKKRVSEIAEANGISKDDPEVQARLAKYSNN